MRFRFVVVVVVLMFAAPVIPVAAHHSVTRTFDTSKEITIRGVITKIEFLNPHTRFWMDVRNNDGSVSSWELELAPPNALKRTLGLNFIKAGDQLDVALWQAKDGSRLANALSLTFPDGRAFNFSRDTSHDWEMLPPKK